MLKRMLLTYTSVAGVFHIYLSPIITFCGVFILHVIVSIGMVLDHVFYPILSKTDIDKPIVVVGNPRTGTTFLQRFLVQNGFGAGMRIWKMLYPSLTLQFLLKPVLPLLEKVSPARFHSKAVHETSLTAIETDDPAILFRYFDGFFLYGFFLAWAKEDPKRMFEPEVRDTSDRDFQWMKKVWKRNIISEKQTRVVAKIFSLGIRIPAFLKKFPDAKILYLVRDPLQTVPSGLSLITGVLDSRFGFWKLAAEKRAYFIERLYQALLELTLRFYDDYTNNRITKENVLIVSYDRMMSDFENLMNEIIEFVGIPTSDSLLNTIRETSEKQRKYKSKHVYDLQKFGLDEARIRKDYVQIYQTFLK